MKGKLNNRKIAILLCDGFEEVEMIKPRAALEKEGAITHLISPNSSNVKGWNHDHWTKQYQVDRQLGKANPADYDALVLPGGVMNPDHLRTNKTAIKFIKYFLKNKKVVAAICHGPWSLIETGKIKGKKVTSYPSIKTDLMNAGAKWQNKKVVIDKLLITSRKPADLPAFNKAIIKVLAKQKT